MELHRLRLGCASLNSGKTQPAAYCYSISSGIYPFSALAPDNIRASEK